MDESDLLKDAKYKSFVALVDKSLKSFEYSAEWADLISALGRLIKVIQSNTKSGYIPRSFVIGKRLAQCLHPALPAGVHCKALECYDVIFRTLGPERIANDLPIYGSGLFALLEPSAMTVKPPLFNIYEEHLLPLGKSLHPPFLGLLKGLLPGLEPGAEFFERGNRMLEMFSTSVGPAFFYTCLWKLLIQSPSIRQYGISFVISHLNRRKPLEAQSYIYGLDKNILVESLCCLFGDSVLLVQRDALDFLLLALPIHFHSISTTNSNPFQFITGDSLTMKDFAVLCTASLAILLRRDASLNRRLFTWLRGGQLVEGMVVNGEDNHVKGGVSKASMTWADVVMYIKDNEHLMAAHDVNGNIMDDNFTSQHYFKVYSQKILIESVRRLIQNPVCLPIPCQPNEDNLSCFSKSVFGSDFSALVIERSISERPFRVLVGLTDHADITNGILDSILLDILWYTYRNYMKLRWQTTCWLNSNQLSSLRRDPTLTVSDLVNRPSLNEKLLPNNMISLIKDHVLIRDSAKPSSLRIDNQGRNIMSSNNPSNSEYDTNDLVVDREDTISSSESTGKKHSTQPTNHTASSNVVDEFLRTAHLFFSNMNSEFLWRFIESQFTDLLLRNTSMKQQETSLSSSGVHENWQQPVLKLSLSQWCSIVHFLLNCLPIDMYPSVCGRYLPDLITHLSSCLIEKLQVNYGDNQNYHHDIRNTSESKLSPSEWASIIGCLDTIVHHIREYAVTMLDQLSIPVNFKRQTEDNQISEELMIIAKAVGRFRRFLGIFCVHVLNFSPVKMNEFVHKICIDQHQDDVFIIKEESKVNRECTSANEKETDGKFRVKYEQQSLSTTSSVSFIDLFAQICRLIVEMSNFPLPIIHQSKMLSTVRRRKSIVSSDYSDPSNISFLDLFGGELAQHPESDTEQGEFILPQWLVCLLYASAELDNFNIKSIALYTLIELFHAAVSIHGWNTEFNHSMEKNSNNKNNHDNHHQPVHMNKNNNDGNVVINHDDNGNNEGKLDSLLEESKSQQQEQPTQNGMRLVFPVLSGELMAYLCQKTNLFTYLGVSLWNYLSPEQSAFHEDTVSLLVRLHQLAPPLPKSTCSVNFSTPGPSKFSSTVSSCIEGFILSQMLSSNIDTQINAHSRYALLWHLMRYYGSRVQSNSVVQQYNTLNKRITYPPSQQDSFKMINPFPSSIAAVSWRRSFLVSSGVKKIGLADAASSPGQGLYDIPFYRCTQLLLDHLDYDTPWGPVGSIGSVGLVNSQTSQLNPNLHTLGSRCEAKEDTCEDYGQVDQPNSFCNSILREQSVLWMEKALQTGQVDRLIAPILAALLHPTTARISLKAHVLKHCYQQVKAVKQSKTSCNDMNDAMTKSASTKDTDCELPSYEEAVNETYDAKMKRSSSKSDFSHSNQTVQSEKFNNLINSIHAKFRRRCSTDEEAVDDKNLKDLHNTKQQAAEAVLNSVLSMRLMQAEEDHSPLDYITDWHQDSNSLSMLPVNEHLLVYLQNYDSNQVIYAFSRLRAILCIAPGLFVRSLAMCPINSLSCFNFYGLNFIELLSRHRRSLGGWNFYLAASVDELNFSLQIYTNLLELIIDLCLQYMCSYLPYITTTTTTAATTTTMDTTNPADVASTLSNTKSSVDGIDKTTVNFGHRHGFSRREFRANQFVQNTAAQILELIVKELICIQGECINSSLLKGNASSGNLSNAKHHSSSSGVRNSESLSSSSMYSSSTHPASLLHQASERRLVQNTLYRTCLPSVVLHCLASCVTKVHWPKTNKLWSDYTTCSGIRKLPTCLQLVLVNDLLSNLPNTFYTTQLQILLKLFNRILHLKPWYGYADRMSVVKQNPSSSSSSSSTATATTTELFYNSLLWPVFQNILLDNESTSYELPVNFIPDIWSKACNKLPRPLNCEPLFRTNCLTALWFIPKCSNIGSERDQASLFTELLSIGLSSPPEHLTDYASTPSFLTARLDLHPLWYRFIFNSLSYWGWFVGPLVRVTMKQVCLSLNKFSDRALNDIQQRNTTSLNKESQVSSNAEWNLIPPDYTLISLALIQGICHAFLLPGGNAILSALSLSRKAPSLQTTNSLRGNPLSVSYLSGLPDSIECAVEIAEILSHHHKLNPGNYSSGNPTTEVTNIVPVFDPLFPSPLTENVDNCSNIIHPTGVNASMNGAATNEPAVILNSGNNEDKLETKEAPIHSPNTTVIFLNRVKNSQSTNIKDDILNPEYHPFIQAQSELLRLMPDIFTSLATLWNAFNQSPLSQCTRTNFYQSSALLTNRYPEKEHWPASMISVPSERLPSLTSLGSAGLVRGAIRRLLKPIAAQHPDLILMTTAVAWPNTIFDNENGGLLSGCDNLLNYGPLDMLIPIRMRNDSGASDVYSIPLHQKQINLLDLISGRTYNDRHYGPILPATVLVNNLRDSIRRPMNNTFLSTVINAVSNSTTGFSFQDVYATSVSSGSKSVNSNPGLNIIRVQISLLHLFYAWLIMKPDFISADLLLILVRDLINMPVMTNFTPPSSNSSTTTTSTASSTTGLPPVAIFILIKIFGKLLDTATSSDDKREQRELQELCHRLLETTASIAASALHQPSWFRKTLQVRQLDTDLSSTTVNSSDLCDNISLPGSEIYEYSFKSDRNGNSSNSTNSHFSTIQQSNSSGYSTKEVLYDNFSPTLQSSASSSSLYQSKSRLSSVNMLTNEITRIRMRNDVTIQAIELLTENMAIFLDLVYKSDEKDRISTFLNNVLCNIFPYLRVRMLSNSDHFTVASKLIASISSYQYTRKSWRRDVLDLFYEPVFFQMTPVALQSWNLIVDNLMTQDKSTFKEALARFVFTQPGGLNLFTNKETEYELRAACLKKLSYLVYASEPDQYAKAMPDLLERLTECLRLGQGIIPVVHAQVFLFARVLISRMSAIQLTSLWPIVVPELFLTFKSLSQAIRDYISKIQSKKVKSDISSLTFLSASQMSLYLGACKFLATSLLCPESKVPQFSYYQWAFVKNFTLDDVSNQENIENAIGPNNHKMPSFVPLLADVLAQIENLQEVDMSNGIDMTSAGNTCTLYQGCFSLLALDKLVNIFALKPFLESLKNNSNLESSSSSSPSSQKVPMFTECQLNDTFLLELALEASLAQEFPETIASR
ncbi:unnamed protein product [Trichobilharzia szidati]|nr:unnamed protein product [Trichobilharzia szidati]